MEQENKGRESLAGTRRHTFYMPVFSVSDGRGCRGWADCGTDGGEGVEKAVGWRVSE